MTAEKFYVVTHPFSDIKIKHDGHENGPFEEREAAEAACTAALGTGRFYQVKILTEEEMERVRDARRFFKTASGITLARVKAMFGDKADAWLGEPNKALGGRRPFSVLREDPDRVNALLTKLEDEGAK